METIANQLKRIGYEEGIHQGRDQGMKASERRIALQLMKTDMALHLIQQVTGLSDSEIQSLQVSNADNT